MLIFGQKVQTFQYSFRSLYILSW